MKKFKVFSLILLGSLLGLSACKAPAFLKKIPGLNKLIPEEQESQKEEKQDEENKSSDDQSGQQGGDQSGEGQQGGGGEGQGEGGGGNQQAGEGATFDFSVLENTSGSQKSYSFTTALGTNSNNVEPAYNADKQELRLYVGNTITITGTDLITSIAFEANTCDHSNANGTLSADKGSLNGFTWSGSANQVTFTVNCGKQVHITKFDINGGGEVELNLLDEFPLEEVKAALEGGTSETFPIPEGEGFEFKLDDDPDYPYSCYVSVYGGDISAYLSALASANFDVDDSYLDDYGMYYATSEGQTLCISLEPINESKYVLNFYAVEPPSAEFPKDELDAYLASVGLNVTYPIPEGDGFQGEYDADYNSYDVSVIGGSSTAYMAALETAGFTKYTDGYDEYGCYYFIKSGLNIDVYPYDIDYDAGVYYLSFYPAE